MTDVGRTLWHVCHTLRHDGVAYGDYLDQLTYLLFLKMAEEKGLTLPDSGWEELKATSNDRLLERYNQTLRVLKSADGLVGDIYGSSTSSFSRSDSLRKVLDQLDFVDWSSLPLDVQADAYEYILERAASEGKRGAGQYFTPRPLMRCIVSCIKPGTVSTDRVLSDPAAGTAGFLIMAHAWAADHAPESLIGRRGLTFHGVELVVRPRRLGLMNLYLHGVASSDIRLGDSLLDEPILDEYCDIVLTNPPFGVKGGRPIVRPEFWCKNSSKQINFVQHVVSTLRNGGRAAIILPDNCFFGSGASQLLPGLFERCSVHTMLRLPAGTFSPYTTGTKTNVLFFTKGSPTISTWIYDARTSANLDRRPEFPSPSILSEFAACFGEDGRGRAERSPASSPSGRWRMFDTAELAGVGFEVDRLPWRSNLRAPEPRSLAPDLLRAVLEDLEEAAEDIRRLIKRLSG